MLAPANAPITSQVELRSPDPAAARPPVGRGSVWPANRARPLSVTQRTSYSPSPSVKQHRVGAALSPPGPADRRAEAMCVVLRAGQRDDGRQLAPPVVELVLDSPS